MLAALIVLLCALAVTGCGGSDSCCGAPGAASNSKGVGRYCDTSVDCEHNGRSSICSTLGNTRTHFCTFECKQADPDECGEGAVCQCNWRGCGCVPAACATLPPGC